MKKFLAIALIAASLTSCGGGKTEEAPAADTTATVAPVDTAAAPAAVDTTKAADTTAAAAPAHN
jgi:hypothetical protein